MDVNLYYNDSTNKEKAKTMNEELMSHEEVNQIEDLLRTAQNAVEEAARKLCSSHNPTAIMLWGSLGQISESCADVIHQTYKLRKFD